MRILLAIAVLATIGFTSKFSSPPRDAHADPDLFAKYRLRPVNVREVDKFFVQVGYPSVLRPASADNVRSNQAMTSIGFYAATYARKQDCRVRVRIAADLVSPYIECATIADNSAISFALPGVLKPGTYEVYIDFLAKEGANLALYAYKIDGRYWLHSLKYHDKLSPFTLMQQLFSRVDFYALFYPLLIFALMFLLFNSSLWSGIVASALFLLGHIIIATPYSGFDETAHIHMASAKIVSNVSEQKELQRHFYRELVDNDFSALHAIDVEYNDDCLHKVVRHTCGSSRGPENYYAVVARFVTWAKDLVPAAGLRSLLVLSNVLVLLLFAVLIVLINQQVAACLLLLVSVIGAFNTSVPFVNNDLPMFLLGIFGAFVFVCCLVSKSLWHRIVLLALLVVGGLTVRKFDRSFSAMLPFLILLPLCFKHISIKDYSGRRLRSLGVGSLFFCLAFMVFVLLKDSGLAVILGNFTKPVLCKLTNDCVHLKNLLKIHGWQQHLGYWYEYARSFFGSYVWGHFYQSHLLLAASSLLWITLTGKGLLSIWAGTRRWYGSIIILALFLSVLAQMFVINSMFLPGDFDASVYANSYLKPRLAAPGIYAMCIPSLVGVLAGSRGERAAIILLQIATLVWTLPQVYLANSF